MKIHLGAEGWKDKGYERTISNNPNEKTILAIDFPRQIERIIAINQGL